MITLYGFGRNIGVRDPSPFVLKMHTYLRMSNIEYKSVDSVGNLQKAPKGKLPFIKDDKNGKTITLGDSGFIIDYLKTTYQADLDNWLSEEQRAISYLVMKSLEENLYFCALYSRWVEDNAWDKIKAAFFSDMPAPMKWIVPAVARKSALKQAKMQGISRHTQEEVCEIANNTLSALSAMLGKKPYLMGDKPCTLDTCAFGMLAQFVIADIETCITPLLKNYENLIGYCHRIEDDLFSD